MEPFMIRCCIAGSTFDSGQFNDSSINGIADFLFKAACYEERQRPMTLSYKR
jgi:hypothetical protein